MPGVFVAASLGLYVGCSDHLTPFFGFVGDELAEVCSGAGEHRAIQLCEPGLHLGVVEAGIDLCIQLVENRGGRVLWRAEAVHQSRFVARDELTHRWDVRQRLRARRTGY